MSALCTFLIPSRGRVKRLQESVEHIEKSAEREDYRIHIRSDSDDLETRYLATTLFTAGRIDRAVSGAPTGYDRIHEAYSALLPVETPWLWVWNDDTNVLGDWVSELGKVDTSGFICHAEFVTNNASIYQNCVGGPFPVVPGNAADIIGSKGFESPIDVTLDSQLRKLGWATHFLKGVTVQHNRIMDDTLPRERY